MPLDDVVRERLAPTRFVSASPLTLAFAEETTRWELFHGRLLDDAHTRQEWTFSTWTLRDGSSPVIAVKLDRERGELHVLRYVVSYVHEAYDEGGAILTREAIKPVRELIATLDAGRADVAEELAAAVARAVTGTRLPLAPAEAPLPAFTFGRLWYTGEPDAGRELEFDLRSRSPEEVAAKWASRRDVFATLRQVFLGVSLSPYTDFVGGVLELLRRLEPEPALDFEAWLLRLVTRHLTAYDLVQFHYRGANYPDALLLDAVLTDYLARLERQPELFAGEAGVGRRAALRQAYLVRRRYEHHPVPDVPTSPGEHSRFYGADYPRVPEEQILHTNQRRTFLFDADPLRERLRPTTRSVLLASVADLCHEAQRLELGAALYLDRPFGGAKGPVAIDATPALASLAFSQAIATQRLRMLEIDLGEPAYAGPLDLAGVPLTSIGGPVRPGTVSLADAARCSTDFVFRRTLPASVRALRSLFDFGEHAECLRGDVLIARSLRGPGVVVYDDAFRERLEFEPVLERGYISRRGVEVPAGRLRFQSQVYRLLGK